MKIMIIVLIKILQKLINFIMMKKRMNIIPVKYIMMFQIVQNVIIKPNAIYVRIISHLYQKTKMFVKT